MNTPALKVRFEKFMSLLPTVENVDALLKQSNLPGRRRADYLAFGRHAIIEQKSFDQDVTSKVQALLDDLVRSHGSVGVDSMSLTDIIDHVSRLPSETTFRPRLLGILTQKVDDALSEADKQTRDTRKIFLIPGAVGIVVVLNEQAQLVEPDYFVDKAWNMLRKRLPTGELRYPENQVVIMISEAHRVPSADRIEIPVETVFSDAGNNSEAANAFAEKLREQWAQFNRASSAELNGVIRDIIPRDPIKTFRVPEGVYKSGV